ncbi:hypothetical protein WN51_14029 [Melipona quadrifasciata]|uniref:Uncharacterized protein n=1 Tax=Melipona quadrifasciata TaxID=166423 RepID=A0A0N0U5C8_9HYME|nr:hypothetical protein WN51_14029 [Melipona quadrifasciata]
MSNARGYPPYPPRGKKLHGPSRCRFYTGPPSSRRSRDQDGRDLLYDLHTITGQSEGTHTHATQTKRRECSVVPAVRGRVHPREEKEGNWGRQTERDRERERRVSPPTRTKAVGENGTDESRLGREVTREDETRMIKIAESRSGFESPGCRDVDERQSAWAAQ